MQLVREFYNQNYMNFVLSMIYNENTLNLFSDASMRNVRKDILSSCYGSVAVSKDTIINELFRLNTNTTVPAAEIRGIRCSLSLALQYRNMFKNINIFSDSQISVFGIRDYIWNWKLTGNYVFVNRSGEEAKNQELYIECLEMLLDLSRTNTVNIFHQAGHVENGLSNLKNAINVFKSSNNIPGKIDYNLIRYISTYNNYVDEKSRSILRRTNIYDNTYSDPVHFIYNKNMLNIK